MARPFKKGLGYFPLDTDFMSNRKIQRLSRQYGSEGISTYICVLCEIYGKNGYFTHCDNDFFFDTSFTLGIDEMRVREIVSFCVQIHLFDSELLEYRQILTSEGIQERYKEISKRNPNAIEPELDLTGVMDAKTPVPEALIGINAPKTDINTPETGVIVAKTPTNGNGNINGKVNTITTTQNSNFYGNEISTDKEEAGRRAELQRMASDAARGDRHA